MERGYTLGGIGALGGRLATRSPREGRLNLAWVGFSMISLYERPALFVPEGPNDSSPAIYCWDLANEVCKSRRDG